MIRSDRGFAAVEWMVGIAVMLLPATVLALSFATFSARANLAASVAQETARAVALAVTPQTAQGDGLEVADAVLTSHGMAREAFCGSDDCAVVTIDGSLQRGSVVRVRVDVVMPAITVPFIGEVGRFGWSAHHEGRVDDYRSFRDAP
jgi:hypothetical protein